MTLTDQLKLPDNKIKANQAYYDLDRKAAKIFALSTTTLDKGENLTIENLVLKSDVVEKHKIEYSPLGKFFNKGIEKENKTRTFTSRSEEHDHQT